VGYAIKKLMNIGACQARWRLVGSAHFRTAPQGGAQAHLVRTVPVAQLDRAPDYESGGLIKGMRYESWNAGQIQLGQKTGHPSGFHQETKA